MKLQKYRLIICAVGVALAMAFWQFGNLLWTNFLPVRAVGEVTLPRSYSKDYLGDQESIDASKIALIKFFGNEHGFLAQFDDRTAAPDGQKDRFLVRNTLNPAQGYIVFNNTSKHRTISVVINIEEDKLKCKVWEVR